MLGVLQDRVCKCARLCARDLMRLVEEYLHFGVVRKEQAVEVLRKRLAASLEQRDRGLDDSNLFGCQRHG